MYTCELVFHTYVRTVWCKYIFWWGGYSRYDSSSNIAYCTLKTGYNTGIHDNEGCYNIHDSIWYNLRHWSRTISWQYITVAEPPETNDSTALCGDFSLLFFVLQISSITKSVYIMKFHQRPTTACFCKFSHYYPNSCNSECLILHILSANIILHGFSQYVLLDFKRNVLLVIISMMAHAIPWSILERHGFINL